VLRHSFVIITTSGQSDISNQKVHGFCLALGGGEYETKRVARNQPTRSPHAPTIIELGCVSWVPSCPLWGSGVWHCCNLLRMWWPDDVFMFLRSLPRLYLFDLFWKQVEFLKELCQSLRWWCWSGISLKSKCPSNVRGLPKKYTTLSMCSSRTENI
jgi:hypothetical protein